MLVSRAIPALYGGVSQQPDAQRSPLQLEAMVNSWATIVDGIGKRAPSEFVAKLSDSALNSALLHIVNRDSANRFVVSITDGGIEVYDATTGERKGVSLTSGASVDYLKVPSGKTAAETFACVSVADYTFVLNKSVVTKLGAYGDDVAPQPIDYFNVNRAPGEGGAHTWQYPPNPPNGSYRGVVQTFQDLPENASEGWTFKIQATVESGFAGYYVRRTQGTWVEVTKPGLINAIDAKSMPHALVRNADGTWSFGPFSWAPRRVGDDTSNPGPSFLGRAITGIFFAANRLGMTVDENTILSRAGDFGNYWRMSAIDLLEDDVIDVAATETKVTKLQHAVPLAGDVMLFSDQVQFRLDGGSYMTPMSVSLTPTTYYPTTGRVAPEPLGSDIYFSSEEGGWARLMEYFVRDDSNSHDAADVTSHVPRLIPRGVREIATSPDQDAIFVVSDGAPDRIFHYKFYWSSDGEKAQSAWGWWQFPAGTRVLACECLGEYLYVVSSRPGGTFLEKVNLALTTVAPGLPHQVYLDERVMVTGMYDAGSNRTRFHLPYDVASARRSQYRIVRGAGWPEGVGGLVDPSSYVWTDPSTVTVPGNFAGLPAFFGRAYEQRWTFSKWFMQDRNGQADLSGRLQVRTVSLYYSRAGYFQTEVAPYGTNPEVQPVAPAKLAEFTGKTLGSTDLLVGKPAFDDGVYSFQVYGSAADCVISITNDSHLGAWFTAAEVEFFWQKRARFG